MNIIDELGAIYVNDDVIARIAALSASQCSGVAGMASKRAIDGIVELLGLDDMTKGIRVANKKDQLSIDLHIIAQFGVAIPEIARAVMAKVRDDMVYFTGLEPTAINVIVEGIEF